MPRRKPCRFDSGLAHHFPLPVNFNFDPGRQAAADSNANRLDNHASGGKLAFIELVFASGCRYLFRASRA